MFDSFNTVFRRIFVVILIAMMTIIPVAKIEVHAESTPTFGAGYNNMANTDRHFVAAMTATFAAMGIHGAFLLADGTDSSKVELWSRKLITAANSIDSNIYEWVNNNTIFEFTDDSAVLKYINNTTPTSIPHLADLVEYLFGENALDGSPFEELVDAPYTVNINGKSVVPWSINTPIVRKGTLSQCLIDPNNFTARGEFLIPYNGAYGSFYDSVWSDPAYGSFKYGPSYTLLNSDGSSYSLTTGRFRTYSGSNDAIYGNWRAINAYYNSSSAVQIYRTSSTDENILFAFMPVVDSNNDIGLALYSYIYSGVESSPNGWNNSRVLIAWDYESNFAPHDVAYENARSQFTFNSNGVINISNDTITITGDDNSTTINNYNDIVNNYFENKIIADGGDDDDDLPAGGTIPGWGGDSPLNFPGINLPDLNIDWNISGLKDKFPFSIPWDLMAFFTILNAPPETPRIQGSVNLGIVDWDIDYSLEDFDDTAELFRNLEFIGFIVGLIFATRRLIGG